MSAVLKWVRRHGLRVVAVVVFALLALGFVPACCRPGSVVLPRLSPILSLLGALGAREWAGWSVLLGVPLLVLSFFRGRVFCWRFCPMGFLAELASKLNPRGRGAVRRVPAFNKAIALVIAATAACGYPLFIWLDPLCIFNGFFAAWREPLAWTSATTGAGFVVVLLLSVAVPNVWCHRLCPLGGVQQAVMDLAQRLRGPKAGAEEAKPGMAATQVARRTVLAAVPAVVAGLTAKRTMGPNGARAVRPPTADPARINALCARCGNCMKACPYGLIHPDLGATGIDGLLTPVLRLRSQDPDQEQFCSQSCTACTQVCPTGALRPLAEKLKEQGRFAPIGVAVVRKDLCVAWAENKDCATCDEYCPYQAVKLVKHGDVNCPVVDTDKCRGCGACESNCPAEPIAITVKPLPVRG